MKKLVLAIAMIFLAGFLAAPVAAEFSAGGSYRAYYNSYTPEGGLYNLTGAAEDLRWFEQRMRIALNWSVNDSVSAQLRGDFAEFNWGDGYRPEQGTDTLMVDRAWVKIKKGFATVTVGQQTTGLGNGIIYSDQFQGIVADLDFSPVSVKLVYSKVSEGGADGNDRTDDALNDDIDLWGASVNYTSAVFSGGLHFAAQKDDATDDERYGYAFSFYVPAGDMFVVRGELDFFDGETAANVDYEGTQFFVAVDGTFSEALKATLWLIWADEAGSGDIQLTTVRDDYWLNITDFMGAMAWSDGYFGQSMGSSGWSGSYIFNSDGLSNGVIGAFLDVTFTASEDLKLYGKLGYTEPEGDSAYLDSNVYGMFCVDYTLVPSVTLSAGVALNQPDYSISGMDDDANVIYQTQVTVTF